MTNEKNLGKKLKGTFIEDKRSSQTPFQKPQLDSLEQMEEEEALQSSADPVEVKLTLAARYRRRKREVQG